MSEKAYEAIELANKTGKIKRGTNEATKVIEKGKAKLIVYAADVSPKEIVMHLPMLCKEKNIPCVEVPSREELGAAAGMQVATGAVAILDAGESKSIIEELANTPKEE
ncbi:ribosomal L7Ae/L30e/S12e/Gadd45 family protein [Candidatus Woesearchaeota archaeon]|nr:ribosomal L7Ae/L30e/S12e/Gadd45 family protein [Candidatus Woesearchaeota archaeon]MCF7901604.1 ribosomal L7Ae/L30e/S12e/Gadd45 family protein [Candidatus Woesearchaeota archaeon]MCF8013523.1 ribosomal L7Ae/L30e/S12e/Gadd45 family protein [Candidatus Woesearchaeota archaeon]